jgi:hypothetical protein
VAANPTSSESSPPARLIHVVSTVNWFAMVLYTLGALAANALLYLGIHGHPPARHGIDAHSIDSVGLNPLPIPWELFAAGGLVMLVVSLLTLEPGRRVARVRSSRLWLLQTTPGLLAALAIFGSGAMLSSIGSYSRLLTVFDPYYAGPVLALIAGLVSLHRWQRDAPPAPAPPRSRSRMPVAAPVSSRLALSLGSLLLVDFLAVAVLGFGGLVINQALYLAAHDGALPPDVHRFTAGTDIWAGYLPVGLPWWVFVLVSSVLLVITLVSWPSANQFGPAQARRIFFRRTTPPSLLAFGLLFFLVEATVDLFYGSGSVTSPAFRGPAIALIVVIVALVRWVTTPLLLRSEKRRLKAHSQSKTGAVTTHG